MLHVLTIGPYCVTEAKFLRKNLCQTSPNPQTVKSPNLETYTLVVGFLAEEFNLFHRFILRASGFMDVSGRRPTTGRSDPSLRGSASELSLFSGLGCFGGRALFE